jgi:hypothetical protein
MSHTNHERGGTKGGTSDRRTQPHGCNDEGANGKRGRSEWKRLSHRAARRNAKQGNDESRIPRYPKTHGQRVAPVLKPPLKEE